MEAINAKVEFVEIDSEMPVRKPAGDVVSELNDLELALVGGGIPDMTF